MLKKRTVDNNFDWNVIWICSMIVFEQPKNKRFYLNIASIFKAPVQSQFEMFMFDSTFNPITNDVP